MVEVSPALKVEDMVETTERRPTPEMCQCLIAESEAHDKKVESKVGVLITVASFAATGVAVLVSANWDRIKDTMTGGSKGESYSREYMEGIRRLEGDGVPKSEYKALESFLRSAENGDVDAMHKLGWMYMHKDDYQGAFEWFTKAAEKGDARAHNDLGWMYLNGKGVPKDEAKAMEHYMEASREGHPAAQEMVKVLEKRQGALQ